MSVKLVIQITITKNPFVRFVCSKMPRKTRNKPSKDLVTESRYFESEDVLSEIKSESISESDSMNSAAEPPDSSKRSRKRHIKIEVSDDVGTKKTGKRAMKEEPLVQVDSANGSGVKEEKAGDKWVPKNWELILENIRKMRINMDAPVDTMGCDKFKDDSTQPEVQRFHTLVSLMLSSQTKDQVNYAAMQRLKEHGLTVDSIIEMSEEVLGKLIYPVGFWRTKAKNIKKVASILKEECNSDIPNSVEGLCKLPGVGPKMAYLAMNIAWGQLSGIGVDTHVHRISNRLKWVPKETKTPEATRVALEDWLPRELWLEVNHLLVGFGQTICAPLRPKCDSCLNKEICPASTVKTKKKKKA